ncbi:hypothetical protein [Mitsuokella sp. WILCCON 0060]|uniref:hypothetical protein n=1 Tax=Mitsuokella sp. WILCCON 0060 TaxID=3345341 RepID=UPI003F19994C
MDDITVRDKSHQKIILAFNFLIALYPFIGTYAVPGITFLGLNELLGMLIIIAYLLSYRMKVSMQNYHILYLIFIVYSTVISLLIFTTLPDMGDMRPINRPLRNIVQFLLIAILGTQLFNLRFFLKYYILGGMTASIFLILQNIAFLFFNITIPWLFPGLPLNYTIVDQATYYARYIPKYYHYGDSLRATGGFTEPTSFAAYILPLIAILLIMNFVDIKKWKLGISKRKIHIAIVICSIAIFISTSATGVTILMLIYLITAMKQLWRTNIVYAIVFGIFFCLIILGVFYYIQTSDWGQTLILRLSEVDTSAGADSTSGNQRIVRGFAVWYNLPIIMQFIGTGFGNISNILITYGITTPYDPSFGSAYMGAIAEVLVSTGIIGMIIFFSYIMNIVYGNIVFLLEIVATFFVLMLALNMLASGTFVLILVAISGIVSYKLSL